MKKQQPTDKKKILREMDHLTRPPRLKNAVHKRGIKPIQKKKKSAPKSEERR